MSGPKHRCLQRGANPGLLGEPCPPHPVLFPLQETIQERMELKSLGQQKDRLHEWLGELRERRWV